MFSFFKFRGAYMRRCQFHRTWHTLLNQELRQPAWRHRGGTAIPGPTIQYCQAHKKEKQNPCQRAIVLYKMLVSDYITRIYTYSKRWLVMRIQVLQASAGSVKMTGRFRLAQPRGNFFHAISNRLFSAGITAANCGASAIGQGGRNITVSYRIIRMVIG